MNKLDALGNEVVIGKRYGYTQQTSGVTQSVIGKVIKFTDTVGVMVEIESVMVAVYSDHPRKGERTNKRVVVKCFILFPVA